MNILYVVTWYTDYGAPIVSTGIFHYEQALALQKTCKIVLYYPFGKDIKKRVSFSEEYGVLTYRRRFRRNKILRVLEWVLDIKKIIRNYNINIIHAHVAGGAGLPAVIASKLFRIPLVVTEHNPIQLSHLDNLRTKIGIGYIYHNAKKIFCVSPYLKKALESVFSNEKFELLYNGVVSPFIYIDDKTNYRKEGVINCAICASFYDREIKGFQYLLPAINQIKRQGYKIALHICGGGQYFQYYKDFAKDLDVEQECIFYNQCEKKVVYNVMNQMDFVISASLFESAGVSIQEALLLGLPVLVTKSGGANSLVNDNCAIVVEVGSSEALANGLIEMIHKYKFFNSDRIKEYAKNNFDMDKINEKYKSAYSEIIKER